MAWETNDPDLTICFEKTALVWVPCAFLWILLPVEIYHICHSKSFDIPLNKYNVTKMVSSIKCLLYLLPTVGCFGSGLLWFSLSGLYHIYFSGYKVLKPKRIP